MRISIIVFVLALMAGSSAPAATGIPGGPVVLRESIIVNSNVVRLGDLFTSAGEKADAAVAYAPEPGKRGIYDARWLYRVARAYGLDWRPMGARVQAVVERESQVIGRQEIEDHILAALLDKGVGEGMQVVLGNRLMRIHVAGDSNAMVAVEDVVFDSRTGRFTAILLAPTEGPSAKRYRVTGRLFKIAEVPVLVRGMLPGEIITAADIQWIKIRTARLGVNTILNANSLIGKAPRRGLRAGLPVRVTDVRRPILVPRGGLVTMILRKPSLMLTAQGKALENGSNGDTIRVNNTQSNKVVEAVVIGVGKVSVHSVSNLAMN